MITDLHEPQVHVLCCVATREIAADVHVVVTDDASDDVRCGHALRPLCSHKHSLLLQWFVDVFLSFPSIREVIVGHKINLMAKKMVAFKLESLSLSLLVCVSLFLTW